MVLHDPRIQSGWTIGTRKAIEHARDEAFDRGQHFVGLEHLLLGCAAQEDGGAAFLLRHYGVTLDRLQWSEFLEEIPRNDDECEILLREHLLFNDDADAVIDRAISMAQSFKKECVGTRVLLLALINQPRSPAVAMLEEFGISASKIRADLVFDLQLHLRRGPLSTVLLIA